MAANMAWIHAVIHYIYGDHTLSESGISFGIGIALSIIAVYCMRHQIWIQPKDWMTRMIPHHSTALTTTEQLLHTHGDTLTKEETKLAKDIIKV